MAKNAVRAARPKTAAQLARKAGNEQAARARLDRLQTDQRAENAARNERVARRLLAAARAAQLLAAARGTRQFAVWLRINRLEASPGTAALFFARHPDLLPAPAPVLPAPVCPINPACDCLQEVAA